MTSLTENTVLARTRAQDLKSVRKLNCWGSELADVSIIKRLPNVEVLSLSVNNISSLEDFSHCHNLQELYIRKNSITDLNELRHLQNLTKLHSLWLADNPCAETDKYRLTVLRALPHLNKLDNITVRPEEVQSAKIYGCSLENTEVAVQDNHSVSEPLNELEKVFTSNIEGNGIIAENSSHSNSSTLQHSELYPSPSVEDKAKPEILDEVVSSPPNTDELINEPTTAEENNQHFSLSVQQSSHVNADNSCSISNEKQHIVIADDQKLPAELEVNDIPQQDTFLNDRISPRYIFTSTYASRLHHRSERASPFRMLPKGGKSRTANILSAVLCLIKELDWASLEVVDTAIHCQMEEIEEEQTSC